MCGPISSSRMSFVAAEMARARRVAQGLPPTPTSNVTPIRAHGGRVRAIAIRTPLGVLTFYERTRPLREVAPIRIQRRNLTALPLAA